MRKVIFFIALMILGATGAEAQLGGYLKGKVNKAIEKKVDEAVDKAVEKTVDNAAEKIENNTKRTVDVIINEHEQVKKEQQVADSEDELVGGGLEEDTSVITNSQPKQRRSFDTEESRIKASNPFYPIEEGLELLYANYDNKEKIVGYDRTAIKKVSKIDDFNFAVTYDVVVMDNKKTPQYTSEVTINIVDGEVVFDPSSMMGQLGEDVKIEGSGLSIPPDIEVGMQLPGYSISIPSFQTNSNASNVKVTSKENLVTGAGSFDCYKIEMSIDSKAMFVKTTGSTIMYVSRGVGNVITENYDSKGNLLSKDVLVEFKK